MSSTLALFVETGFNTEDLDKLKRDEMRAMLEEMQMMRRHLIDEMGKSIIQLPENLKSARENLVAERRMLIKLKTKEQHILTRLMISVNRDDQLANWVRDRQKAKTKEVRQALGRTLDRALEEREKEQWEEEEKEWRKRWEDWKMGAKDWDEWEEFERQWEERERQWELEYAQTELDAGQKQDAEKLKQWDLEWRDAERYWREWREWEQRWDKEEEQRDKDEERRDKVERDKGERGEEQESEWQWRRQERDRRQEQRNGRKKERQIQEKEQTLWKQQWREQRLAEERQRERQQRERERQRREGERQRQKEERDWRSRELERQHEYLAEVQTQWKERQKVREQERQEQAKQERRTPQSKRLEIERANAQKWEEHRLVFSFPLSDQQLAELKELQLLAHESLPLCIVHVQQWEHKLSQLELERKTLEPKIVKLEYAQAADAVSLELAGRDGPKLLSLAGSWFARRAGLTSWFPLDETDLKKRRHKHRLLAVMLDNRSAFANQSPKLDALLVFVSVPPISRKSY